MVELNMYESLMEDKIEKTKHTQFMNLSQKTYVSNALLNA